MAREFTKPRMSEFPGVASADARERDLKNEYAELRKQYSAAVLSLNDVASHAERIRYLAAMQTSDQVLAGVPRSESDIRGTLGELQEQMEIKNEAIKLQHEIAVREREKASCAICKAVLPQWQKLRNEMRSAMEKLADATDREYRFRQELQDDGVCLSGEISNNVAPNREWLEYVIAEMSKTFAA